MPQVMILILAFNITVLNRAMSAAWRIPLMATPLPLGMEISASWCGPRKGSL